MACAGERSLRASCVAALAALATHIACGSEQPRWARAEPRADTDSQEIRTWCHDNKLTRYTDAVLALEDVEELSDLQYACVEQFGKELGSIAKKKIAAALKRLREQLSAAGGAPRGGPW